jgi:serine/threonine-protein kinase
MALARGTRLGSYEIAEQIGVGGMGEVYRATDRRLKRDVAIKVLLEAVAADADRLARFQREAELLASLNHPGIAQVHGLEDADGFAALIMELVEGPTLADRIVQGPIPVAEALPIARQIAEAIEAAHAQGVVHRDLKPANIKLRPDGTVKVLDFGLAKAMEPASAGQAQSMAPTVAPEFTEAGLILGTVAYMSPEQAQGRVVDTRSDIFSFGAVLYEVLTGRRAFRGGSTVETLAAVLRDEPAAPDPPTELHGVVVRCLRKQPAERYQSVAELRAALEEVARGRTTHTTSIAVLPFTNLSADKDNEYFGDGLAEEILNALTQIHGLRVIARTSAFRFRGEQDLRKVSNALRVGSVLTGSVRRAGNRIRVSAQLIDPSDDSQLWSERYDRELRDVFDIQDEIAQAIVAQLKGKLGAPSGRPLVKRYSENLEAHSLYLKGNFHLYRLTAAEMDKGRAYLEQAVALEPGHARAWLALADYHIAGCFIGTAPPSAGWSRALEIARAAVAADGELAEAHAALAFVEGHKEHRWDEALARFGTALALNPSSARAHFWYGDTLFYVGRAEEGLAELRRAVELDPLLALYEEVLSELYLFTGQQAKAEEHARHVLEIDSEYPWAMAVLGECCSLSGRHAEGVELLERACQRMGGGYLPMGFMTWAYVRDGRRGDAERFVSDLEAKRRERYVPAGTIAFAALALGDVERGFEYAEKAADERDPNLPYLMRSPYFDALDGQPRYDDLFRRMNLRR